MYRVISFLIAVLLVSLAVFSLGCSAKFEVVSLNISQPVCLIGETATVTASVTNSGGAIGEYFAEVLINGVAEHTEVITIEPEASYDLSIHVTKDAAGEYVIQLGTATSTLTVLQAANLRVSPSEVEVGQPVNITADLKNLSTTQVIYNCRLFSQGEVVEAKDVSVAGDSTSQVSFEFSQAKPGSYALQLLVLSDSLKVLKPAEFMVNTLSVPKEMAIGELAIITTEVTNIGEVEGMYSGNLKVGEPEILTRTVSVSPGQTEKVSFDYKAKDAGIKIIQLGDQSMNLKVLTPSEIANDTYLVSSEMKSAELPGDFREKRGYSTYII